MIRFTQSSIKRGHPGAVNKRTGKMSAGRSDRRDSISGNVLAVKTNVLELFGNIAEFKFCTAWVVA